MLRRMDTHAYDVIVIGAGIAGATAAAHLSADRRVVLLEAEEAAGYHTTGRSAALWILNYGSSSARVLTGLSRTFLLAPPASFSPGPLMTQRPVIYLAPPDQEAAFRTMLAEAVGVRET